MNIEELEKRLEENSKHIIENANRIEENLTKIHQNTGALGILKEFKSDARKFFIMWIITFIAFMGLLAYTIFLLNDVGANQDTIEIQDVETIDNTHIKIGDDIWEKSE